MLTESCEGVKPQTVRLLDFQSMVCFYGDMSQAPGTETFLSLKPSFVRQVLEEVGGLTCGPTCRRLGAASNRTYEVELIEGTSVVVRFYRPGRWSAEQIREEHQLLARLDEAGVPICPVCPFPDGDTLKSVDNVLFTLFEHHEGEVGAALSDREMDHLGGLVGEMHRITEHLRICKRSCIAPDFYIGQALAWLESDNTVPISVKSRFFAAAETIAKIAVPLLLDADMIPVHGDLHSGNILRCPGELRLLDFDEVSTGPAVQDLWLVLRTRDSDTLRRREIFLASYRRVRPFDLASLRLIEILRAMRMVHYSGWRARCWYDPIFRAGWPDLKTEKYWQRLTVALENQLRVIRWELQKEQKVWPE